MKKRKNAKKLSLHRETLTALDLENVDLAVGRAGYGYCPEESFVICSEVHTCVSCQDTTA